jgi:transcriptional regulator with XRE-family HTH domain
MTTFYCHRAHILLASWQHKTIEGVMTFAENLRRFRVERFLSQRELARQAGLHPITLVRLEAGATAPSTRTVRALAAALNVGPRELTSLEEVAELRRVLKGNAQPRAGGQSTTASRDP